jgi:hypothetical protein
MKNYSEKTSKIQDELRSEILRSFPDSRERSIALTKLEECYLWLMQATVNSIQLDQQDEKRKKIH